MNINQLITRYRDKGVSLSLDEAGRLRFGGKTEVLTERAVSTLIEHKIAIKDALLRERGGVLPTPEQAQEDVTQWSEAQEAELYALAEMDAAEDDLIDAALNNRLPKKRVVLGGSMGVVTDPNQAVRDLIEEGRKWSQAGNVWEGWHNAPDHAHALHFLVQWWQKEQKRQNVAREAESGRIEGQRLRNDCRYHNGSALSAIS